jgi:hypothetical protein
LTDEQRNAIEIIRVDILELDELIYGFKQPDYWTYSRWRVYSYDVFFPLENLGGLKRLVVDMPDRQWIEADRHRPSLVLPPLRGFVKQCGGRPADIEIILQEDEKSGVLDLN